MLTPCLGRAEEMAQLRAALCSARWATVVGPPGSGKTLLARHVLHGLDALDTAAWVNARGLDTPDAVLDACLDALGTENAPSESRVGSLGRALDGVGRILVLDGLEIDPETVGQTLQDLVESTADARVLITSPTMAAQPAEHVVRVGPMALPDPSAGLLGPAVDLLLSRVRQAGGQPVDLVQHHREVRRLLEATGGLPLLIEQVAVQVALVGPANVAPAASMAAAVRASYELLDVDQQSCFRRVAQLSVPVSIGVLAEVAEVSRSRASRLAGALVRRSLVEVLSDGRFDMLTPIRQAGRALAAPGEDVDLVARALMRWADRVAPADFNFGAADAPWLIDTPAMLSAVQTACADRGTREFGYQLANRVFSSFYTGMHCRDAVTALETALASGDGPPEIGAQVARRAGIAASEVRGTYEGLWLLDRADMYARDAPDPSAQLARTASIRAEMHLDAGDLDESEREANRAIELEGPDGYIVRQAMRTVADVHVSRAMFPEAIRVANTIMPGSEANDELWIALSARTLLARVALEQGRPAEAIALCRAAVREGRSHGEDRVALLAETLLRHVDPEHSPGHVDRDTLPWAVRLQVLAQDAREIFGAGHLERASELAADVVALADGGKLGRDAVEARLLLGRTLLARGDLDQAASTLLACLQRAVTMPMPLRVADALDGLAEVATMTGSDRDPPRLRAAATAMRTPRHAVRWGYAARSPAPAVGPPPDGWVVAATLTKQGQAAVAELFAGTPVSEPSALDALTRAERQVADRVAGGLTSRRIAEELFVSPRTVDAHLTHIYRKLDINSRARLAAIVTDERR